MNKLLVSLLLGFIFLHPSLAIACKSPDWNALLYMKDNELRKYGCVHIQVQMRVYSNNNEIAKVIKIGKQLRDKGLLEKNSLMLEAEALYSANRYKEALNVYLQSKAAPTSCDIKSTCGDGFKFSEAIEHYMLYKFFYAAGLKDKAITELNLGDAEFTKRCPLNDKHGDWCKGIRTRLLLRLELQNYNRF